jgi:hypothetical protein
MSGSLSIILVLASVALTFIATRPSSRPAATQAEDGSRPAAQRKRLPARRLLSRADASQRLRTDRTDIQRSVGRDYSAPEPGERLWPPIL